MTRILVVEDDEALPGELERVVAVGEDAGVRSVGDLYT